MDPYTPFSPRSTEEPLEHFRKCQQQRGSVIAPVSPLCQTSTTRVACARPEALWVTHHTPAMNSSLCCLLAGGFTN